MVAAVRIIGAVAAAVVVITRAVAEIATAIVGSY